MKDCVEQAAADAENIFANHVDDIAVAVSRKKDIDDPAMWVHEGHALAGIVLDMEQACETLCDIPADLHETDSGQWDEPTIEKIIPAMAMACYEKLVLNNLAKLLEDTKQLKRNKGESWLDVVKVFADNL